MNAEVKISYRPGSAAIPRDMLSDSKLSIDTRGALAWMMSHSNNYTIRRSTMLKVFGCGRAKYDRMIKEAKTAGYLRVETGRNELQQFQSHYIVSEVGFSDNGSPDHLSDTIKDGGGKKIQGSILGYSDKFLEVFPSDPKSRLAFEFHLGAAIQEVGIKELLLQAEKYQQSVANRACNRKVALPENWLRDGQYLDVLE